MLKEIGQVAEWSWAMFRYNLKIIFGGKFIYFFLAGITFYLFVAGIFVFESSQINLKDVYFMLLTPGILLAFYPSVFGIQNDMDQRTVEILFTIPNYRFKVWLVRLFISMVLVMLILFGLSYLTEALVMSVPNFEMVGQVMFPIIFISSFCFMVSTKARSGLATAVIVIIVGLFFWILYGNLPYTPYQIFLNPFEMNTETHALVWENAKFGNRLYLILGSVFCLLYALKNLQQREKFR